MKVILLERVERLGTLGDVVTVKDGYARNFLLPRSKALRATSANLKVFDVQRAALEVRNQQTREGAEANGAALDGTIYAMIRQAGETGQLYGSVSTRDIADIVTAGGVSVNRNQVSLLTPIKAIGLHTVPVLLHPEVIVVLEVVVLEALALVEVLLELQLELQVLLMVVLVHLVEPTILEMETLLQHWLAEEVVEEVQL